MRKKKVREARQVKQEAPPDLTGDFAVAVRELGLAYQRLQAKGHARWLLEFAYLDLSKLSQGQYADIRFDVHAFALEKNPETWMADGHPDWQISADVSLMMLSPTVDDVPAKFQDELRTRFEKAKQGEMWEWRYPSVEKRIMVFKSAQVGGLLTHHLPSLFDQLMSRATDVIEREFQKFGICENPRCRRAFVAQRKGKVRFCQPKCSAYVRVTARLKKQKARP